MNQAAKGNYRYFVKAIEFYEKMTNLVRQLNPKPVNELESVERVLAERFAVHDSATEDFLNEMRRKTRRI
jgi:hypothetical protein